MKSLLQTLFFFLLVTQISIGQWYQQNSPTTQNLNAVTFINANNGFAVGDGGVIINTTDGGVNWTIVPSGTSLTLNEICFIGSSNGWIVGGNSILHTTDGGSSWVTQLSMPSYTFLDVFFLDADNGFVVGGRVDTLDLIILRTVNAGLSWIPSYFAAPGYISRIHFIDSNTGWYLDHTWSMYGLCYGIFKTNDGGASWIYQLGGCPGSHGGPPQVYDIYFKDANNGLAIGDVIYRTTDGGDTWIDTIAIAPGQWLNRMSFSSTSKVTAVGGNGIIYQSTDAGETWLSQTSGTDSSLNGIYFVDELKGWIVGDGGTILHTTNGGVPVELTSFTAATNGKEVMLNWSTATELNNQGFEIERSEDNISYNNIGFEPGFGTTTEPKSYSYSDQAVQSGTYYYRLKQVDYDGSYEYSDVVEVDFKIFNSYLLEQNYPNPFNPSTAISYRLPVSGDVTLKVFDILGNELETLVNEEKPAGTYEVTWYAESLPSGVYFYQLRAGSFVETKKMLLLK